MNKDKDRSIVVSFLNILVGVCWLAFITLVVRQTFHYVETPKKFEFTKEKITFSDYPTVMVCPDLPFKYDLLEELLHANLTNKSGLDILGLLAEKFGEKQAVLEVLRNVTFDGTDLVANLSMRFNDHGFEILPFDTRETSLKSVSTKTCAGYNIEKVVGSKGMQSIPQQINICFRDDARYNTLGKTVYLIADNHVYINYLDNAVDFIKLDEAKHAETFIEISKVEYLPFSGNLWYAEESCIQEKSYDYDGNILSHFQNRSYDEFHCCLPLYGHERDECKFCNNSQMHK